MRFEKWAELENLTPVIVAKRCGLPLQSVYALLRGDRIPRPPIMAKIYLATNGAVQPNDFYDLPPLPAADPIPQAARRPSEGGDPADRARRAA